MFKNVQHGEDELLTDKALITKLLEIISLYFISFIVCIFLIHVIINSEYRADHHYIIYIPKREKVFIHVLLYLTLNPNQHIRPVQFQSIVQLLSV